jgi:type II secretory pathway component PulF
MPDFQYLALKGNGEKESGVLVAAGRPEALRVLARRGLQPVRLVEAGAREAAQIAKAAGAGEGEVRLSRSELLYFTEDVADLLEGGLQLEPALAILEKRQAGKKIMGISGKMRNYVREGGSFSKALRLASPSFTDLYCSMCEAGEISGSLGQILRRQASFLQAMNELQSKVVSALIYPAVLVVAGIGLLIIFVTVLVPNMMGLLKQTKTELPTMTKLLIAFSNLMVNYWWAWVSVVLCTVFGFMAYTRTAEGKLWWHKVQLDIPLFGAVLKQRAYTQMTYTLGTLLTNGIPLLKGLELMNRANPNLYLQLRFKVVREMVEEGGSLSLALRKADVLPGTIVDMIAVGEQTGDLGPALLKISQRNERLLLQSIERLTSLVQPAVIIFIAGIVLLVAYSIFSGIFSTISGMRMRA